MKPSIEDIRAYVDGEVSEALRLKIIQASEMDDDIAAQILAFEASKLPFRAASSLEPIPPLPEHLREHIETWTSISSQTVSTEPQSARWKQPAMAAALLLFGGIGYIAGCVLNEPGGDSAKQVLLKHQEGITQHQVGINSQPLDSQDEYQLWVQRVADYQSLYVRKTVSGITRGRSKAVALLQSLNDEYGLPTKIPDLTQQGYQFIRAQQLGFNQSPLVQLVYLSSAGPPLALCFMPVDDSSELALVTSQHAGLGTAFWQHNGIRFVIVAKETAETLTQLANDAMTT